MSRRSRLLNRRQVLGTAMAVLGAAVTGAGAGRVARAAAPTGAGHLFVPGYRSGEAVEAGRLIADMPGVARVPAGWDGPRTLVSVLDLAAPASPPRRAAYPVRGHGLALVPSAGVAIFVGMEGESTVAFDPDSLDLVAMVAPRAAGWCFGGHAAVLPDGRHVAIAERAPAEPAGSDRAADLERMAGRIVVREAASLRPVAEFPSYGLRPHDLRVTEDGRHLVVANYGSTVVERGDFALAAVPHILAPCAAIIDLASGALVDRLAPADLRAELRHLVAPALDRVFAILARVETAPLAGAAGGDPVAGPGFGYAPARPVRRVGHEAVPLLAEAPELARQGLSIGWDPQADAVLMTFPSSHLVAVFDGASGRTSALIRTDAAGLRWPCGLSRAPDGRHWLVTGYWGGVLRLDAASFRPAGLDGAPRWWGHSHTAVG